MILGKPTLETVFELVREEGCPICGDCPDRLQVDGPDAIRLECGHTVDAKDWIESHYQRDLDASELEGEDG